MGDRVGVEAEDPRGAGVAVRGGPPAPGPRRGVRSPVGRVRPLPPSAGQRRPHGERDGRARDAGDGRRAIEKGSRTLRSPTTTTGRFARTSGGSGLSYDLFSRTTTLNHERVTQDLFRTLYEHGAIVEQTMLVSFSPTTGHTLPDRYIEGTCPICGYPEARGDQCDNCGNQLDPTDLIEPALAHRRLDARVPRDEAPVPRPAAVRGAPTAPGSKRTTTGAERQELLARAFSTRFAPARSRATSTGACGSRSTATPRTRTSASTSGSTP